MLNEEWNGQQYNSAMTSNVAAEKYTQVYTGQVDKKNPEPWNLLGELALAERDSKSAGISLFSFLCVGPSL